MARTISNSAIRDQRFNSYLALDGAAWLHNLAKKRTCDVFGFSYSNLKSEELKKKDICLLKNLNNPYIFTVI